MSNLRPSLDRYVGKRVIHRAKNLEQREGKFVWVPERRVVFLMALAKNWAMVRRPGCAPYVCATKELRT